MRKWCGPRAVAILLAAALAGRFGEADAQVLDIHRHYFAEDVVVLGPADYLSESVVSTLRRVGAAAPDSIAVGSLNGVRFQYRSNALAFFAVSPEVELQHMSRSNSWTVECRVDPIDDSRLCLLLRESLTVSLAGGGELAVVVGSHHFPETGVAVRVDRQDPHLSDEIGFTGPAAASIVAELRRGESVTTRYHEWPRSTPVDATQGLYGFAEAEAYLRWVIARVQ